mgnify:CR=1 FL=1
MIISNLRRLLFRSNPTDERYTIFVTCVIKNIPTERIRWISAIAIRYPGKVEPSITVTVLRPLIISAENAALDTLYKVSDILKYQALPANVEITINNSNVVDTLGSGLFPNKLEHLTDKVALVSDALSTSIQHRSNLRIYRHTIILTDYKAALKAIRYYR